VRRYLLDTGPLTALLLARPPAVALMESWLLNHEAATSVMDRYAHLRRLMRPPRGSGLIGDIDTLIAATALEHDLTVVTTDGDFTRIPGLSVLLLTPRTYTAVEPTEL
jgi:hypothetical protein